MGNVLAAATKDNTRFTIFENDQVLTADQLNDLFNYLDVQTRLTRTRAIGIGIICGLEIGQLENKQIVVSKGTAITSDGDLLHVDADQVFDRYVLFEDNNAKYPYLRVDNDQVVTAYQLSNSSTSDSTASDDITTFEASTNTLIKDYVGILYLEDYQNDPDVCTGTDCDNKGAEAVRELKVLLVHKDNLKTLLQSIPPLNKNYFSLEDMTMPRAIVNTSITQLNQLNTAFTNALTIKSEIQEKLVKAYQTCQVVLQDEFDGGDPTSEWNQLLDTHFNIGSSIYIQYVYDFARDLTCAYNEMREVLFGDNMLCCPDVALFPKHVLLGTIKTAAVSGDSGSATPALPPIAISHPPIFISTVSMRLRFDIGSLIKRFNPVLIDIEYRHSFYESPVLNNKEENIEKIKFCFMRIHSMIHNFKIPTADTLQNVTQSIKITPGYFEDKLLGKRSLPFYYDINTNLPANLYWNYDANVRKKENEILSYSANKYANKPAVLTPLLFNLFPYDFFRIEGHIGFKYQEVERVLNDLILNNNLPINIITVQVENAIETIPDRPWFFPHLYLYQKAQQKTFLTRLDEASTVNTELKTQDNTIDDTNFNLAKQIVIDNSKDVSDTTFRFDQFSTAVSNVVDAASSIKAQTKQYTFSNAAIPHDFVNNTDILQKTDVVANIYQQQIIKKKQGLMLGNFMKQNPGLEHAGGVLRGGTFVLVYTATDQNVVADFMLPYASIDKDIVVDPPIYQPLPLPEPPIIKFPLDKVFEKTPLYITAIDNKLTPYVKVTDIDAKVASSVDLKVSAATSALDTKINAVASDVDTKINATTAVFNTKFDNLNQTNSQLFDKVLNTKITTIPRTGDITDAGNLVVGGTNLASQVDSLQKLQNEVISLPATDPNRAAKESQLLDAAQALTDSLNSTNVTADPSSTLAAKSILSDINTSTSLVTNADLQSRAAEVVTKANNINKGILGLNR